MSVIYLPLENFNYPNIIPSRKLLQVVKKDGLIEPIIINKKGQVFIGHRERFMAFKELASHHPQGATSFIAVLWENLTLNDKRCI